MKLLYIDKRENFMIRLMERTFFEYCHHYLIEFDLKNFNKVRSHPELLRKRITLQNVDECTGIAFNVNRMKSYLIHQNDKVEGFLYYTKDTNETVGCIWVMYRGGNEFQYRMRKVDAFGFDFGIRSQFRGQGYIVWMIYELLLHLKEKRIEKLYASVRTNNQSAIKAYNKAGMRIVREERFFRIVGIRVLYPIV